MKVRVAVLAAVMVSVAGVAEAQPSRNFSVAQAKRSFHAQSGLRLFNFREASTSEVTSLRTRPYRTLRFGTFQLFVLDPRKVKRLRRVFTHGVAPDARGVHWVPDRLGGWIAVTVHEKNLVLAWFPPHGSRGLDPSWERLSRTVLRFAPRVRR